MGLFSYLPKPEERDRLTLISMALDHGYYSSEDRRVEALKQLALISQQAAPDRVPPSSRQLHQPPQ